MTPEDGRRRLFHDLACLLGHAVDLELGEKARHSLRVGVLAREVARVLGVPCADAFYGGLLHDVGQVVARAGYPVGHTRYGAGLLRPYASLRWLEPVVAHHHERWDGDGEPRGLAGFEIPQAAAVVALADGIDETVREVARGERQARAVRAVLHMRDAAVAAEVAEAGLQLLDSQPGFVDRLFEAEALAQAVAIAPDDPPRLSPEVTEIEIVAELSWMVARLADARHAYRIGHSARVAFLAHDIAARLGGVDRWDVACAALLHDVGKLFVPATILRKKQVLAADELAVIHGHAEHTRRVLERIERLAPLAGAAAAHHEAWDGTGYPRGSSGEAIPLIARIVAYADVYDALTHPRAHRDALPPKEALATVRGMVGRQLDPGLAVFALAALSEARPDSSQDLLGFQAFFAAAQPRVPDLGGPMQQLVFAHRNFLHTREAVVFTDARARVLDVNFAFTRLFGYRADEVLGRSPSSFDGGVQDREAVDSIQEALRNPEVGAFSGELTVTTKDGHDLVVQLGINAVRDAAGTVVGYVATAADVTARRRAQEELAARERDLRQKNEELERLARFKSQMVAITSHDLRSPLASIIQTADRLADECGRLPEDEAHRRLHALSEVGHDLLRLVTDLLDLDKLEQGRLSLRRRPIRANALVEGLAGSALADGRIAVTATTPTVISADAERLEQSLQNLATNGLRYGGGDVVEVGCAPVEGGVRFWVDDRGPGIPAGEEEGIFDRYRQLEGSHPAAGGHGLGLAIVRHLAELHGGRAWAENRPEGGSRFVIEVPKGPDGASALLLGPDTADLRRLEQAVEGRGLLVVRATRIGELERRLSVEAPTLAVIDASWVDVATAGALTRAQGAGTAIVLVARAAGPRPPWCDLVLESPVAAVELSPILRPLRPTIPPPLAAVPQGAP